MNDLVTLQTDARTPLLTVIQSLVALQGDEAKLSAYLTRHPPAREASGGLLNGPWEFACAILPFLRDQPWLDSNYPARVPTSVILGGGDRWTDHPIGFPDKRAAEAFYTDPARAIQGERERAEYILIRPLGLFIAHEGKHRVPFLRSRGVQYIPAAVCAKAYPAPDRITIYQSAHGDPSAFAVLDGRSLVELAAPGMTIPLLQAYDVSITQQWPPSWPSVEQLRRELAMPQWKQPFGEMDIEHLARFANGRGDR